MTFKTKRFACSAFDATLIVTATIDCPSETTQTPLKVLEYLSEASLCCERFVRDRLLKVARTIADIRHSEKIEKADRKSVV